MQNEALNSLLTRRSVRAYRPDALDRETLETIVRVGKSAPSGMNRQQYHITVVTSAEGLKKLSDLARREILSNTAAPEAFRKRAESPDFNATNGAPCMILVSAADGGEQDAALCCANLLNGARALGVGSCWFGAFSHLQPYMDEIRADFAVPAGYELYAGIAFGYPAADDAFHEAQNRRDDNVNWVE